MGMNKNMYRIVGFSGLLLLMVLGYLFFWPVKSGSPASERSAQQATVTSGEDYYTCPMHPSVRSDRPGACPVCGMALVKKSSQTASGGGENPEEFRGVSLSPTQRVIANISTVSVKRRALMQEISAVGVVAFSEPLQATVAARFRGRIEKLYANYTGLHVRKGEPLFELYSPDLVSAEQEFLLARQGGPNAGDLQTQLLQASRSRLRIHFGLTENQVQELESTGSPHHTIAFHSPIAGTVIQKQVQEGEFVSEGMMLYQLADLSRVWVYLDLYEKDIRMVHLGQTAEITTDAYPADVFRGVVKFVDPVVNAESRTVRVRTEFANGDGKLKPNMYVKARLALPVVNAIVVPAGAVLSTGKRSVVWVETGANTFEPRDVSIGATGDEYAEVLHGLREGEKVAATGGFLIDSESALSHPPGTAETPDASPAGTPLR